MPIIWISIDYKWSSNCRPSLQLVTDKDIKSQINQAALLFVIYVRLHVTITSTGVGKKMRGGLLDREGCGEKDRAVRWERVQWKVLWALWQAGAEPRRAESPPHFQKITKFTLGF